MSELRTLEEFLAEKEAGRKRERLYALVVAIALFCLLAHAVWSFS